MAQCSLTVEDEALAGIPNLGTGFRRRRVGPIDRLIEPNVKALRPSGFGTKTAPQFVGTGAVFTGREHLGYQAFGYMVVAEEVTNLAYDDDEQVHPALLALVAGLGELGVVARRRIGASVPAGCV